MASAVAFCGAREPRPSRGTGDPYRQEVRENHLGTMGAQNILPADKNTQCAAYLKDPVGLYVLCCLCTISRFYLETRDFVKLAAQLVSDNCGSVRSDSLVVSVLCPLNLTQPSRDRETQV